MKISCLPVSLFDDFSQNKITIREWARKAHEIGYDGIDISMVMLKNHTPAYLDEVKKMVAAEKLSIIMATTYPDFTHPSEIQRERELDFLKRDIAMCDELGIRYLRVLAGQAHPGVSRKEGITNAVRYLKLADTHNKKYGNSVMLLYENHAKPGAWAYVDFSYPLDIFYEVLDGISDTDIRLNFDIGNIVSLGDDPLSVFARVADKVETVHISDMAQSGRFAPVSIGRGVAPIEALLSELKERAFDGWLCIEEASGNGFAGISDALAFVKNALQRV